MTGYSVGRGFEWKARDDLTANGYDVLRAAGSKGGTKIDLAAFKPGQLLLIQCKRTGGAGALPAEEWDRLLEVSNWVGAIPILAVNGLFGRGVVYMRLLGPKRYRGRIQPIEPFWLDGLGRSA